MNTLTIEEIREEHYPYEWKGVIYCAHHTCYAGEQPYPCETIRTLDGE